MQNPPGGFSNPQDPYSGGPGASPYGYPNQPPVSMGIVGEAWQTIQANLGTWLVAMIFYILIVGAPTLTYSSTRRAAVPFG